MQTGQWNVASGKVDGFARITEETRTGLLGSGTKTTSYDAAGNVTGRSLPGGKTQTLKWDGLGRLVQVQERDGSNNATTGAPPMTDWAAA